MKHLAWDFDGTIINIFDVWKMALTTICQDKHLVIPDDREMKGSFGNSQWNGFSVWNLPLREQENYRLLGYEQFYLIQKNNPNALPPVVEVIHTIMRMTEHGYLQSIITSRPRKMLLEMLDHLKVKDNFHIYNAMECALENHLKDKPAPDKLLFVMNHLSANHENSLVIGDTIMDIGMATNANTKSIGVTWGMGSEIELNKSGASLVLSDPATLENAIHSFFENSKS
jgi:phosphoglycolate phosphatase